MVGSIWVLLLALALFGTTLLIFRFIEGRWTFARLPLTWFYASWLTGLALLTLPLFKYHEEFSSASGAYLIAVLFSFSLGSVAAAFWGQRRTGALMSGSMRAAPKPVAPISDLFIGVLLVMGLVGTSLLLVNSVLGGSLSLTDRLDSDNLAAIRFEQMAGAQSRIGPLYGPANLMSSVGGLGAALVFYLRGMRAPWTRVRKWLYLTALVVLAFNVMTGFIGFGSRMFAVYALLVAFLAFAEGRWAIGERLITKRLSLHHFAVLSLSAIVTTAALWAAATVFLEKRVQHQDPQTLLFRTHRATFDPFLYQLTRRDLATQYFFFSLSYLTTPIPTLTFYLDLPEASQPGPFFGEYNFPAVGRWGRRLTFSGDPYAWEKARLDIFKPLGDIGFGTNVWSTLVRDLIADFTKGGALLFLAALAFLSHRLYDLQRQQPAMRRAALLVYLRLLLIFTGLISSLFMPQIYWPLYLAIFLAATGSVKRTDPKSRSFPTGVIRRAEN